jgi:gliding motility-associated-like protein
MTSRSLNINLLALVYLITSSFVALAQQTSETNLDKSQYQQQLEELLVSNNQLFRENKGQWDPDILYRTSGVNADASFYSDHVFFSLHKNKEISDDPKEPFEVKASFLNWRLNFNGAQTKQVTASESIDRNINYFTAGAEDGRRLLEYKKLLYQDIYANIDLKFYNSVKGDLKYDYILKPGANVGDISMEYEGVKDVTILENGKLSILTEWGEFLEDAPYSYQIINGQRQAVDVSYKITDGNVGFEIHGEYDASLELIIDPIYVDWSTYFYGDLYDSNLSWGYAWVLDIDIDDKDNVYVCGMAYNQKFQSRLGGYDSTLNGTWDAYICKISPNGDSLIYFSYFGGSRTEYAMNISVSATYEAAISGITWGGGFPVTPNAFDKVGKSCGLGWCWQGFVTKFSSTGGSLIFSTYLTGRTSSSTWSIDWIRSMQVTDDGKVYLVGNTTSEDFPTTTGCYQDNYGGNAGTAWWNAGDGFLTCLKSDGTGLVFSTYIGGSGADIARDVYVTKGGEIYVVGQSGSGNFKTTPGARLFNTFIKGNSDGFIIKFKKGGNQVAYAKLMGGDGDESFEGIYATEEGDPYIIGNSNSNNFYTTSKAYQRTSGGGYDIVVVKLISSGTNVRYSTYLGGNGEDGYNRNQWYFDGASITANVKDEAIIAATSKSSNYPVTADALQSKNNSLSWYGKLVISKLSYSGSDLKYSTYYGGSGGEFPGGIRAKRVGCVTYILSAGNSWSSDYPTTKGVYKENRGTGSFWTGFITKFRDTLYTEPIALGLLDTMVECDNVFVILDAKNRGADFLWSDGTKDQANIVRDSGEIWVRATYGCDTVRDTLQVLLEHSPKVPVFDNDTTYCDFFPSLVLDAKNDTIISSYLWNDGTTGQTMKVDSAHKYYVEISTPNCGTASDTLNLKFLTTPIIDLPRDTVDCDSVSLTLDAGNGTNEADYRWSTLDSTQSISVKDTGLYTIKVTNFCGFDSSSVRVIEHVKPTVDLAPDSVFCNSVSYVASVGIRENGESYAWTNLGDGSPMGSADTLKILSPVYVKVTVDNGCGTASDSMDLSIITTPVGGVIDTIYECDAVSETLVLKNAKADNEEVYSWSISGADSTLFVNTAGLYKGYITNKCGVDSSEFLVVLKHTPTVKLPNDSTYCGTIDVVLDVTDPDPEMVYKWQGVEGGPTLNVVVAGGYGVELTNRCGSATDNVSYKLLQMPVVDLGDDQVFCGTLVPQTYTVGTTLNEETYAWSSTNTTDTETIGAEGDHWVTITNYCGEVSDTVNFRVSPYPVVSLGPDTILCGDFELPLDAGNPGMTYFWLPTEETTQKIKATQQVTYTVEVTNADGCMGSDDFRIGTECISFDHIPSSFSPNGDGLNDMFRPTLINYQDYTMTIFNRWGEAIFESDKPENGWDGTYQGKVVQNGVYLYNIRFIRTETGEFKNVKGLVHVLR